MRCERKKHIVSRETDGSGMVLHPRLEDFRDKEKTMVNHPNRPKKEDPDNTKSRLVRQFEAIGRGPLAKAEILREASKILARVSKLIILRRIENLKSGRPEEDPEDDLLDGLLLVETRLLEIGAMVTIVDATDIAALHAARREASSGTF
jgi:hypothetical protein